MYKMIDKNSIPISKICPILNFSRDSYYKWKTRRVIITSPSLKKEIQGIALEFPFYGYRRITKELHRRDLLVNHKKVLQIMREDNLLCRRKNAFKPVTTQSDHDLEIYSNLINNLKVTGLNQLWVGDITYIRLVDEFIYLASILDVFSRKCIGWSLKRDIDTSLALNALIMALHNRKKIGFDNLIHHSDRGLQYASNDYVKILQENKIKISMSRKGNPYDNAFAESFNKTIKVEEIYINDYETFEEAYKNIKKFIELVYNKKRLHSSIGYIPPEEYEMEVLKIE
ncbi:MAG: IS3 family transposase [Nanoarchaeota archaeon]